MLPSLEVLEPRALLSLILDMDTGIDDPAPPGTAMLPLNFAALPLSASGDVAGHGTLMARIASERGATLIEEACATPDGLIQPYAIYAAAQYDAKHYAGVGAVVVIPAAGQLSAYDGYTQPTLLAAFHLLARAGIPVVVSAGDAGTNNDVAPFWPAQAAALGATNVLVVAGTVPEGETTAESEGPSPHALQLWSNYGPSSVPVAVPAIFGTSGAAILGGIAVGAQLDATPRPPHVRGDAYAAAITQAVIAGAAHDDALDGLVRSGELADLTHTVPLVFPIGTHHTHAHGHAHQHHGKHR